MGAATSQKTIAEVTASLLKREVRAVELAEEALRLIEEKDKEIHAYLEVFSDVLDQACRADEALDRGEERALLGIPIAVKDNILIEGKACTAASRMLENYTATYDATVIGKLKAAGAVLVGRTNMDEFAMGSSTENSAYGVTKNPHDLTRVPGGSSGGSAAAVATGSVLAALGSDTGGSIRQPASFCGVVGLKPTYGAVSRSGLIAMGSSLDVIGPLATNVADAELLFHVIAGKDPLDMTSREADPHASSPVKTIGVPRVFLEKGMDPDVGEHFDRQLNILARQGYAVQDVELPTVDYALPAYYIVMPAEASTNLARYDGVRYGRYEEGETLLEDYTKTRSAFGSEVKRRILIGTYVLSSGYYDAYYVRANAVRAKIRRDFERAFEHVDVIVTPTSPTPAFKAGEKSDPLSMYLADIFTVPANLTGMPALSVPMGTVSREGTELPVGFQIIGPDMGEARLFDLGKVVEAAA